MPCPTVENVFIEHAEIVRNDVVKSIQDSDYYIKNLTKEPWLDGNGYQYTYPIYERSIITKAVTDADFWTAFATPNDTPDGSNNTPDDGACNLPGHTIDSFGITMETAVLKKAAVNSPDICLDTLRFQWQVMDQIKNITRVLAENTKWVWSNAYQDETMAASANKITAGVDGISSSFNVGTPPTSMLTFGLLEEVHQEMGFNGGSINPKARLADGTPVYDAVGSTYTFGDLKRQDANTRNDFNAEVKGGNEEGVMIRTVGLSTGRSYHGFLFNAVQFPPRYDGSYNRVYPYSSSNATKGKKWEVASAYKTALYEDTVITHPDVLRILIPKPTGTLGGMTYQHEFSWAGEFVWRNIPDRTCNIDGNIGFFRALFAYGVKLERPDLGFVIRHLRCGRPNDLKACSS